jgi:hypothetical protein
VLDAHLVAAQCPGTRFAAAVAAVMAVTAVAAVARRVALPV